MSQYYQLIMIITGLVLMCSSLAIVLWFYLIAPVLIRQAIREARQP